MKKEEEIMLHCKDCPFYSGIQCHGHGEFWGDCQLLHNWYKIVQKVLPKGMYTGAHMKSICLDETECHLIKAKLVYIDDLRTEEEKK